MLVLNSGPPSQPKRDFTLMLNILKIKIVFKLHKNHMFYKMTLLPLPQDSEHDKKMIIEHNFQISEYDIH